MQTIDDEYIKGTIESYDDVWVRTDGLIEIRNKFELLCKTIKYLANKPLASESLDISGISLDYKTCLCSCNKCEKVYIIEDMETNIKFGVGSQCIKKFKNKKLTSQLNHYLLADKCESCDIPLMKSYNPHININSRKGFNLCFDCHKINYKNKLFNHIN